MVGFHIFGWSISVGMLGSSLDSCISSVGFVVDLPTALGDVLVLYFPLLSFVLA